MIEALKYLDKDGEGYISVERDKGDYVEVCARNDRDMVTYFFLINGRQLMEELPLLFREGEDV